MRRKVRDRALIVFFLHSTVKVMQIVSLGMFGKPCIKDTKYYSYFNCVEKSKHLRTITKI